MDLYLLTKWLHILGAAILFGTGAGIAFFMFFADRTGHAPTIAATARMVVWADFLFTTSAVILQPITGYLLVRYLGISLLEGWVFLSLILYVVVGACWLPVVWIQIQMRDLAEEAVRTEQALPAHYHRLARLWFVLGWHAFLGVLIIFWLMIAKPIIW